MATAAFASAAEKYRPVLICDALSGPTAVARTSTPVIENVLTLMGATFDVAPVEVPPDPGVTTRPPLPWLDPVANRPWTWIEINVSAPEAARTPCRADTSETRVAGMVPSPGLSSNWSREKRRPARCAFGAFRPNLAGPPDPAPAAWVTVTSVPTPYSDCRTVLWAVRTPAAMADTVTTRPIPSARPSATTMACR